MFTWIKSKVSENVSTSVYNEHVRPGPALRSLECETQSQADANARMVSWILAASEGGENVDGNCRERADSSVEGSALCLDNSQSKVGAERRW